MKLMEQPANKPRIDIIEGSKDVVITVIHNKVKKIRTHPVRIYEDEEIGIMSIAKELNKATGVTVIINNTDIDLNSTGSVESNVTLLNEIKEVLNKINPSVVLDLHGMADKGPMFLNSVNDGLKIGREIIEKTKVGNRPDVDIEFRRKASSNFCTSRGETVIRLAKYLSYVGLATDIEAVYPGGNFIGSIACMDRDVIALEISRSNRLKESNKKKLISAIIKFINSLRGESVPDEVNCVLNVETKKEELEKEEEVKSSYIG